METRKVTNLITGHDNVTRGARVLLANRNSIECPIQIFYPLEISEKDEEQDRLVNSIDML